jgi:hypothetical protein
VTVWAGREEQIVSVESKNSAVSSVVGVHQIPEQVLSLITLAELNYVDMFTITTPEATANSPEEWARAVLERAPLARRNARVLWRLMGLRLGPPHSADHVQGWKIVARGDNWLRLETASWYLAGQAICLVEDGQVSISLSLHYTSPFAKVMWRIIEDAHKRGVSVMLRQAVGLMTPKRLPAERDSKNPA